MPARPCPMPGLSRSASDGSSDGVSGRAALACVGFAGSFFECLAGSRRCGGCGRSGLLAIVTIWVESVGAESDQQALFQPDSRALDHLGPFLRIRSNKRGKFFGRPAGWLVADIGIELSHALGADRAIDRDVELFDDRRRQAFWCDHAR